MKVAVTERRAKGNARVVILVLASLLLSVPPAAADPMDDARMAVRGRKFEQAVAIWRREAGKGNPEAQYQLGAAYRSGRGVDRDDAQSVRWLEPAAKAGHAGAQYQLGVMIQNGWGVAANREQAIKWYRAAARSGNDKAKGRLRKLGSASNEIEAVGESRLGIAAQDPDELLLAAIRLGDASAARVALKRGANPHGKGVRPLFEAVRKERPAIVASLLKAGAKVDVRDDRGTTPLMLAAEAGNLQLVDHLLAAKPDIDARDRLGRTSLMLASLANHPRTAGRLIGGGASVNLELKDGQTALSLAVAGRHKAVAQVIRKAGGREGRRSDTATNEQWLARNASETSAPLVAAAARGNNDMVRRLLAMPSHDVGQRDRDDRTGLHHAATAGHVEVLSILLEAGADHDARSSRERTALHDAASAGKHEAIAVLLSAGASIDATDQDGRTPLHLATQLGSVDAVDALLRGGASAGVRDANKRLALDLAVEASGDGSETSSNHVAVARRLLKKKHPRTALQRAACTAVSLGRTPVLRALIVSGVKPASSCEGDVSLLMVAAGREDLEPIDVLLRAGADPDANEEGQNGPLIVAASHGFSELVARLLEAGAEVDARGYQRTTALIRAVAAGKPEIARLLLAAGASTSARDSLGNTAKSLAKQSGRDELIAALEEGEKGGFSLW